MIPNRLCWRPCYSNVFLESHSKRTSCLPNAEIITAFALNFHISRFPRCRIFEVDQISGGFGPSDKGLGGWGVAGHPDPEITRGLGLVSKKIILALRASVWSKNNEEGGGGANRTPPLDPPLQMLPNGVKRLVECANSLFFENFCKLFWNSNPCK